MAHRSGPFERSCPQGKASSQQVLEVAETLYTNQNNGARMPLPSSARSEAACRRKPPKQEGEYAHRWHCCWALSARIPLPNRAIRCRPLRASVLDRTGMLDLDERAVNANTRRAAKYCPGQDDKATSFRTLKPRRFHFAHEGSSIGERVPSLESRLFERKAFVDTTALKTSVFAIRRSGPTRHSGCSQARTPESTQWTGTVLD